MLPLSSDLKLKYFNIESSLWYLISLFSLSKLLLKLKWLNKCLHTKIISIISSLYSFIIASKNLFIKEDFWSSDNSVVVLSPAKSKPESSISTINFRH